MITRPLNLISSHPKRLLLIAVLLIGLTAAYATTVEAKPLPKITGGGVTLNANHGIGGGPTLWSVGGFNAQRIGDGDTARGQMEFAAYIAPAVFEPDSPIGRIHATPVCMVNLGPSKDVKPGGVGGDPNGDVWEIRFMITQTEGLFIPTTTYGSAYVQDNGRVDYSDENFASPDDAVCGDLTRSFGLEPVLEGNIKVHD